MAQCGAQGCVAVATVKGASEVEAGRPSQRVSIDFSTGVYELYELAERGATLAQLKVAPLHRGPTQRRSIGGLLKDRLVPSPQSMPGRRRRDRH
jgi:hypothetical protein